MKEFSIPLISDYTRPVIELYKLPALIDTGALIPVFSIFPSTLEKYFDIKLIFPDEHITGFGGEEKGAVYSISNFKVGELIFKDFEIFVPKKPHLQFPFLLSANLFHGLIYEIDTINQKFTVRMKEEQLLERECKIKKIRGQLYPQIDGVLFEDIDIFLHKFWII